MQNHPNLEQEIREKIKEIKYKQSTNGQHYRYYSAFINRAAIKIFDDNLKFLFDDDLNNNIGNNNAGGYVDGFNREEQLRKQEVIDGILTCLKLSALKFKYSDQSFNLANEIDFVDFNQKAIDIEKEMKIWRSNQLIFNEIRQKEYTNGLTSFNNHRVVQCNSIATNLNQLKNINYLNANDNVNCYRKPISHKKQRQHQHQQILNQNPNRNQQNQNQNLNYSQQQPWNGQSNLQACSFANLDRTQYQQMQLDQQHLQSNQHQQQSNQQIEEQLRKKRNLDLDQSTKDFNKMKVNSISNDYNNAIMRDKSKVIVINNYETELINFEMEHSESNQLINSNPLLQELNHNQHQHHLHHHQHPRQNNQEIYEQILDNEVLF